MFFTAVLLAGCASQRHGVSRVDRYDDVRVDQMVGNNVSGALLQRTVLCLNARRETRKITATTNVVVTPITNFSVTILTNQTVSASTNYFFTVATNLVPLTLPVPGVGATAAVEGSATTGGESPPPPTVPNPASVSTNVTVSLARNVTGTASPTQTAANSQIVRTLNNQITTVSNNLSVSVMTNQVVTLETNQVLTYVTNATITAVTNVTMAPTNGWQHDYFLYTELLGATDFALPPGESLVVLVDGVRYGFAPGQSGTAFVSRKGFTSTLYRVSPEILVAVANGKEVCLRLKGVNSVIERTLSHGSKQNFKEYLLSYFTPAQAPPKQRSPADRNAVAQAGPLRTASVLDRAAQ